jgi:predicted nucleic acid-binding protein
MKVFIDTNVLIDIAADRKPFSEWAIKLFKEAGRGNLELYTSTMSILTTFISRRN